MRVAFFALVLANLVFFVWSQGYFGGQEEGREPQRMQNQLSPEKMSVTRAGPAGEAPASESPPPAVPTPTPAPAPETPPPAESAPAPQSKAAATQQVACRRIDGVAPKDGGVLQQSLQKAGFAVALLPLQERSFWVNISGLPNPAAADKKAGELKQLGVTDFHVIQAEGGGLAISLGIFSDEAAANQFLQGLTKKGVKSARIDARAKPASLRLELRGDANLFAQRLPQVLSGRPGLASVECL